MTPVTITLVALMLLCFYMLLHVSRVRNQQPGLPMGDAMVGFVGKLFGIGGGTQTAAAQPTPDGGPAPDKKKKTKKSKGKDKKGDGAAAPAAPDGLKHKIKSKKQKVAETPAG